MVFVACHLVLLGLFALLVGFICYLRLAALVYCLIVGFLCFLFGVTFDLCFVCSGCLLFVVFITLFTCVGCVGCFDGLWYFLFWCGCFGLFVYLLWLGIVFNAALCWCCLFYCLIVCLVDLCVLAWCGVVLFSVLCVCY